jgi:hypothetical protein
MTLARRERQRPMTTVSIVYHPAWDRPFWPEPGAVLPDPSPSLIWLALALALAIAGLALGHLGAMTVGIPLAYTALLPTIIGLWIAISVGVFEFLKEG